MRKIHWIAATIIPLFLLPLITGSFAIHMIIMCWYYMIIASSWNLVAGFSGQVSLAQVAFAGLGSYTSALFVMRTGMPIFVGMLVAGILGWGLSYSLGVLCLRLRGNYLTLATLGFSESIRLIITIESEYTGGSGGLGVSRGIAPLFQTTSVIPYYYSMTGLLAFSLFIIYKVVNSNIGLYLRAINDDEDAAVAMGVDVTKWRTFAFSISGLLSGLAGAFYAHYVQVITPSTMVLGEMAIIMAMAVFGGMGSFSGPIIGAFMIYIVSEYARLNYGQYSLIIFGLVVIIMMRFSPGGLHGIYTRMKRRAGDKPARKAVSTPDSTEYYEQIQEKGVKKVDRPET